MADGTFKTAIDLQVGDILKTIDIPNSEIGTQNSSIEYVYSGLTYESLATNTTYSSNPVTFKRKVNRLSILVKLTFTDGTDWEDTIGSSYLVDIDGAIQFKPIVKLKEGNVVLLLNTSNEEIQFVRKTIVSVVENRAVFSGWMISVETAELFLTKTSTTNNESFVSIEHNSVYCPVGCLCSSVCPACPKGQPYCSGNVCGNAIC